MRALLPLFVLLSLSRALILEVNNIHNGYKFIIEGTPSPATGNSRLALKHMVMGSPLS